MLLKTLGVLLLSSAIGLANAQNTTSSNSNSTITPIASQYGDQFKNAGGKILHDTVNVYIIFYGDWTSSESQAEQTTFMNFVDNVSSTPWFSTFKEYTDSNGNKVTGPLNVAAAVADSGSHGLSLTDTNTHKQIVLDAVNSGYLSATNSLDSNGVYVIMAGSNVNDSQFCHTNCGYNSYSDEFQYMFIGYPGTCSETCIPPVINSTSPNESPSIDAAVTIFSHEIQDLLTDPRNDAWIIQANGGTIELGDFCAGQNVSQAQWFGTLQQDEQKNNSNYNIQVGDKKYLVQTVYSMEKKECVLSDE
ncbi:hypothetical protein VTP01DRAFT_7775 [Rhizomucor pusillus]|uniref:uncharacterized protein n=1 Tax=Rhizomucor pusillus TaxID=4840 RepID=UPI003743F499